MSEVFKIDRLDLRILAQLQRNGRMTNVDLADAVGLSPSPWFDTAHYVAARGEHLALGVNPLVDYLLGGAWRISEPRPGFATAAYLAARPEIAATGLTPLEHWARLAGGG